MNTSLLKPLPPIKSIRLTALSFLGSVLVWLPSLPMLAAEPAFPLEGDSALRSLLQVKALKSLVTVPVGQKYVYMTWAKITDGKEIRRGDAISSSVEPGTRYAVQLLWGNANGEWNGVLRLQPVGTSKNETDGRGSSGGFFPNDPFFGQVVATTSSVSSLKPTAKKFGPYYLLGGAAGRQGLDGHEVRVHRDPMMFPTDKKHSLLLLIAFFPDQEAANTARRSGEADLEQALAPLLKASAASPRPKS